MLKNRTLLRQILIFILSIGLISAIHLPAQSQSDGLKFSLQAQQLDRNGQLVPALEAWEAAAAAFAAQGDRLGRSKSLINQSQLLQDMGLYPRACNVLLQAFEVERPECSPEKIKSLRQKLTQQSRISLVEGIGLRSLGSILRQKGQLEQSNRVLQLGIEATQHSSELPATLLALGNTRKVIGDRIRDRWSYDFITEIIDRQEPKNALQPYQGAFNAYQAVERSPLTQTLSQLNHLSLLIELETWWQQQTQRRIQSWQRLSQISSIEAAEDFLTLLTAEIAASKDRLIASIATNLPQLTPSRRGIYAQINYAKSLVRLQQTAEVETVLRRAWQQAQQLQDPRAESYALGYLAQNYEQQGNLDEAIALTNEALSLAEAENAIGDAREISYLWQSQLGKLLEQSGQKQKAIAAYTLAFDTLQSLRADLNTNNQVVQFNFRQEVKPVYLSLANLLLSTDAVATKSLKATKADSPSSNNIELARQVIESLQLAELDNFFQDPCLSTADVAVTIDDLDPQAAVIYPIVLGDRLEVILSMAGKPLKHFVTKISQQQVEQTLDSLYDNLHNQSVNNSAVNIFNTTLVNPREVIENTQALLPNLEEVYRWLIEPLESELTSNQIETLVFVTSGRLQNVPMAALYNGKQYLLEQYGIALAPSLQLLNSNPLPKNKLKVLAAGLSQQVEIQGEIFPALDNVPEELNEIETVFPRSQQLLDREFTLTNIEQQLEAGFPIVHLATHGVFSSDPNRTFIITGDRNLINLNTFSTLLASSPKRPELIVLSACDTATGDERATLGLAGVAVRSGSSTVASLWSVEDESTTWLMKNFYRQLENPTIKKVKALQQAQRGLIELLRANPPSPELKQLPPHPYYWASYVLLGNWQ